MTKIKDATKINDYNTGFIVGMLTVVFTMIPYMIIAGVLTSLPQGLIREVATIIFAITLILTVSKFFKYVEKKVYAFIIQREIISFKTKGDENAT